MASLGSKFGEYSTKRLNCWLERSPALFCLTHYGGAKRPNLAALFALAILLASLLVLPALNSTAYASDSKAGYAVVIKGAHLLRSKEGAKTYHRVAYLPVGTIVELDGEKSSISVKGRFRDFSSVRSQSGVKGYLSDRLFRMLDSDRMAVPVSSDKLPLFAKPYAESEIEDVIDAGAELCIGDERCIDFSRHDGIYLTITEELADYYQVILTRTDTKVKDGKDLQRQEKKRWYLEKILVKSGKIKLIDAILAEMSMTEWLVEGEEWVSISPDLVNNILEKIDEPIHESKIWCDLSVDATGQIRVGFYFAEAGLAVGIAAKKKGEYESIAEYTWKNEDGPFEFTLHRDVKCDSAKPENTTKLTLESSFLSDEIKIDYGAFKERSSDDYIFLKRSGDDHTKMVIVHSWPTYNAILRQIERLAGSPISPEHVEYSDDPSKLREIQKGIVQRQNLYDFILRQIAIFDDPS